MAFTFDAGLAGRKRDEEEERPQSAVRDDTRVYNEGGRKVGDLPTVTPRDEDEQPMVYDPGVNKPAAEEKDQYADLHPEQYEYSWTEEQRKYYDDLSRQNNEALGLTEPKTESPKKAAEEKPIVYVPPSTNTGGTSGAGTNAAGTKTVLTVNPEGATEMEEQWKEYLNQQGKQEPKSEAPKQGTDRTAAANRQERRERGGADRAERNAPQGTFQPRTTQGSTAAPANDHPAYAWQGIRPGDYAALMDLMTGEAPRLPETGGTPRIPDTGGTPAPQREPDSVRYAREAAERRNAAAGSIAAANANREAVDAYAAQEAARREKAEQLRNAQDQAWLAENGFSWAGQPGAERGHSADQPKSTLPDPQVIDRNGGRSPEEVQEDFDIQVRILKGQGYSQEEAERRATEEFGPHTYSGDLPSYVRKDVPITSINPYANNPYLAEAAGMGLSGQEAQNYADRKLNALIQASKMTDAEKARRNPNSSYYYEAIPGTGTGSNTAPRRSGEERADQNFINSGTPTTGGNAAAREDSSPRTSGEPSPNPNRPGANAEVNSWSWEPSSVTEARRKGEEEARRAADNQGKNTGAGGTTGTGTGTGTGSGTGGTESGTGSGSGTGSSGNGKNKDVPEGSKYYPPSYNQEGKVVKAPYRKGGYTEEEIIKMGNDVAKDKNGKPLKDRYGNPFYEGYYKAPGDGHYYPVDQIKANYYRENGSYAGWNEGMREYWNTFGTFYGYRPGWKVDGRLGSGGGGGGGYSGGGRSGGGYSYGGGSSSSGRGGGATANNGLYWNGNTSWNI